MHLAFRLQHFAHKTLLTFLGPADLQDHADPRVALQRQYDARLHPERMATESSTLAVSAATAAPAAGLTAPSDRRQVTA